MFGRNLSKYGFQFVRKSASTVTTPEIKHFSSILKRPVQLSIPLKNYVRGLHGGHDSVQVQYPAPPFQGTAVVNGDFKEIDLNDFKGQYLVLFFYPLDFTFVCPTEIIAFSDRIDEFKSINTAVVGVSCDSHFSHLAWINTPRKHGGLGELKYPLLADFSKTIARDYNVLLEADGVPLRGLFIIDPQGIVRQITVNDLPVGRSVDEVIRLVKAFQFTDKHGEVMCMRSEDKKVNTELMTKFSVPNIKAKTSYDRPLVAAEETEETLGLSTAQLERVVLLDQLKFYRLSMEELLHQREEAKKRDLNTVRMLQGERDCIAV